MKKGASLVWIVIISTALLFISVTTANFVIKESKMSVRMDDSSRAYAAAESGIDWGKYCLETPTECDLSIITPTGSKSFGPFNVGGSKYTVTISKTNVSGKIITKIESLGTSSNVNRKLEYVFAPNASLSALPSVGQSFAVDGSYVQQFDYWTDGGGLAKVGIGNSATNATRAIYFDHYSFNGNKYFRLVAIKEGRAAVVSNPIDLGTLDITEPYAVRVRIEYFQDLSARLTISQATDAAGAYECLPSPVGISLSGLGLTSTDFTNYYFSSAPAPASLGYGNAYKVASGASFSYVDNMRTLGLVSGGSAVVPPPPPVVPPVAVVRTATSFKVILDSVSFKLNSASPLKIGGLTPFDAATKTYLDNSVVTIPVTPYDTSLLHTYKNITISIWDETNAYLGYISLGGFSREYWCDINNMCGQGAPNPGSVLVNNVSVYTSVPGLTISPLP